MSVISSLVFDPGVRERLVGGLDKLAGSISYRATIAAAEGQPAPWRSRSESMRFSVAPGTAPPAERARAAAIAAAFRVQQAGDEASTAGAEALFSRDGLHPMWWGVSKAQLAEFVSHVKAAQHAGKIKNPSREEAGARYYPQEKFDDPEVEPRIFPASRTYLC